MTSLLSEQISQEMDKAESDSLSIARARTILETALIDQFRTLASGLLAAQILRHGNVDSSIWVQHVKAISSHSSEPFEPTGRFPTGLQEFAKAISNGSIKPVQVRDLATVELRIYRNVVGLCNDLEVNRQLSALGSNLRLAFPGSHQLTALAVRNLAGIESKSWPIDARFILGNVGLCSASFFGPLFEFKDELAVSPFFEVGASGFHFGHFIVVRHTVLLSLMGEDASVREPGFALRRLHTLTHELVHATSHQVPGEQRFGYANAFWSQNLENDICRYARASVYRQQCEDEFNRELLLYRMIVDKANKYLDHKFTLPEGDVSSAIDRLISSGRLQQLDDDRISSCHQDGWTAWSL